MLVLTFQNKKKRIKNKTQNSNSNFFINHFENHIIMKMAIKQIYLISCEYEFNLSQVL